MDRLRTPRREIVVTNSELPTASPLLSRRRLLAATAAGLAALPSIALAQRKGPAPAEVSVEELMKPGDLPDLVLGKSDSPVTIVEYASMTCGHCANFHNKVFPALKEKYIDSGKVRFIMREFPLDNLAAAASMLARCAGGEKSHALVGVLFEKQEQWAFVRGNPVPNLFEIAKQAGFTQDTFDKCLTDQRLLDQVTAVRTRASEKFQVSSTPTFFINGKRMTEAPTIEGFDKALGALLKS